MPTLSYRAIITPDDVAGALLRSDSGDVLRDKVLDETGEYYGEGVRTIEAVTARIEGYLGRSIIVRRAVAYVQKQAFARVEESPVGDGFRLYVPDWPIVEMIEPDSATLAVEQVGPLPDVGTAETDATARIAFTADTYGGRWASFAGYRRPDQVLSTPGPDESTLPTGTDEPLDGLSTLPPTVPPLVSDVAVQLCLMRLTMQADGLVGTRSVSQQQGEFSLTVQRLDDPKAFETRQLNRLTGLKAVSV
jgi:hypothetical protein